jgi:non-canonical (house-cleaning) NTP pyrophosphatase
MTAGVVIVGSQNGSKLRAATMALERVFPERKFEVRGTAVTSAVSAQPMSDEETMRGAIARARLAAEACPDAVYAIGMEGGVSKVIFEIPPFFF